VNRKIIEHAASLTAAGLAELHIAYVCEAYGEQGLRSARSPYHFDVDTYVESERERNRTAMNAYLAEVRESLASEILAAFNPVCHMIRGGVGSRSSDSPSTWKRTWSS
jgi:hypothetical protein